MLPSSLDPPRLFPEFGAFYFPALMPLLRSFCTVPRCVASFRISLHLPGDRLDSSEVNRIRRRTRAFGRNRERNRRKRTNKIESASDNKNRTRTGRSLARVRVRGSAGLAVVKGRKGALFCCCCRFSPTNQIVHPRPF